VKVGSVTGHILALSEELQILQKNWGQPLDCFSEGAKISQALAEITINSPLYSSILSGDFKCLEGITSPRTEALLEILGRLSTSLVMSDAVMVFTDTRASAIQRRTTRVTFLSHFYFCNFFVTFSVTKM